MNVKPLLCAALSLLAIAVHAGNFTVLHSFGILTNVTGYDLNAPLTQGPDGTLYGVASRADGNLQGVVFRVNADGTGFKAIKIFTNFNGGSYPDGGLVLVGGMLYGTTVDGGTNDGGIVFGVSTNGSIYTNLYYFKSATNDGFDPSGRLACSGGFLYGTTDGGGGIGGGSGTVFQLSTNGGTPNYLVRFNSTNGSGPTAGVIIAGNTLYGATSGGGTNGGYGTIFKVNTDSTGFSSMFSFDSANGSTPVGELLLVSNTLYGACRSGGTGNTGDIFAISTNGNNFTNLYNFPGSYFDPVGIFPNGALVFSSNLLYGTTTEGGTNDNGTIFSVTTNGNTFTTTYTFQTFVDVACGLIISNSTLLGTGVASGACRLGGIFSINANDTNGSSFTNFFSFAFSDGDMPTGVLAFTNGALYGVTYEAGLGECGTLYRVNSDGSGYSNLYNFTLATGGDPEGGPLLVGNTFYGTTSLDDTNGYGSIFAVNTNASGFTNFFASPGNAQSGLLLLNGTLYGTTTSYNGDSSGDVYALSTNGQNWTNLLSFAGSPAGGVSYATLVASSSDLLYGTTEQGAANGSGAVFSIATNGSPLNVVYAFSPLVYVPSINRLTNSDGGNPLSGVLLFSNTIFGTTSAGGPYGLGTIYRVDINGSNFMNLHNFTGGSDGAQPKSTLVLSGNTLYGTSSSGSVGYGTIFSVATNGSGFSVLHSFTGGSDGATPLAGLILSSNTLYGTASAGGNLDEGVVFSIIPEPVLTFTLAGNNLILTWSNSAYSLQSAPTANGTFTTLGSATSPYTNAITSKQEFFRLISN